MIKSLEIQNYKSIKHQIVNFGEVNILIGANNSGKSNLLDSIFTIQSILRRPLDEVFTRGPFSFGGVFCKSSRYHEGMSFKMVGDIDFKDFEYFIKLSTKRDSNRYKPIIIEEKLKYDGETHSNTNLEESFVYKSENIPKDLRYNINSKNYQFVPKLIKKDHSIVDFDVDYESRYVPYLLHDGSNLIDVLYYIREYEIIRYSHIIQECQKFFPNLQDIKVESGLGTNSVLQVIMKNRRGKDWRFIGPQLSDGFVIILSIITLLSSERLPNMILFEELENGLNPSSIDKLLNIMFEVARKKNIQFLITTHSPMFLQLMRNSPESVIICEQDENGLSHYISLKERLEVFKEDYEEGDSLIDLWFSGLIGGL